jgi:membrane protein implicated in regulation of membrane protease activity
MRALAKIYAALLPVVFLFVRHQEAQGRYDSIGLWYSIYVTVALTLVPAVAVFALFLGWKTWRRRRSPTDSSSESI